MLLSVILIFIRSFIGKVKGFGARTIQIICLMLIIPTLLILALEKILVGETVATIIGGLIGYVLTSVGDEKKSEDKSENTKSNTP